MKMKKNWKRFFTLDRHHAEGFTLVELIVVIAILAILAGVAVPAYSGYIAKANEAADLQLLGAVNNAFAVACIENNLDIEDMEGATILIDEQTGLISGMSLPISTLSATPTVDSITAAVYASFEKYYGENMNTPFKVYTKLIFNDGAFVDVSKIGLTPAQQAVLDYLKETYGNEGGMIDQWLGSTFSEIGSEELLGQVDWVTGIASSAMTEGSDLYNIVNDPEYLMNLMNSLDMDETEFTALIEEKTENGTLDQFMANSLVLSVAQNVSKNDALKKETITEQLSSGSIKTAISGNLADSGDPETALAQAALAYGMYTSYANYIGDEEMIKNAAQIQDLTQLSTMLNDMYGMEDTEDNTTFQEYMAGQGAADLDGYLAALEMAGNGAAQDSEVTLDVLNNGFGGLEGLLGSLGE